MTRGRRTSGNRVRAAPGPAPCGGPSHARVGQRGRRCPQEAWLRLGRQDPGSIDNLGGWLIAFDSIKGFKNSARWTFSALDANRSTVVADVSYELPGGIAGIALGKVIEPFVKIAVKYSSAALQKCVEAQVPR